jgi:very-short-patch-repair endonuclease
MAQNRAERRAQFKKPFAKNLRKTATEPERVLWSMLRSKQMVGLRFRRQQPIGSYIVDFYCSAAKLVVELDGEQHATAEAREYDEARTEWLNERGIRVLRIANGDLLKDREMAIERIWTVAFPSPNRLRRFDPPSRGGWNEYAIPSSR